MRNKIIIAYEPGQEFLSELLFVPLSTHWEFEVKKLCLNQPQSQSSGFFSGEKITSLLSELIPQSESKILKEDSEKVLAELRSFQPPIVICLSPKTVSIVSNLKKEKLYLGKLAAVTSLIIFEEDAINSEVDLYLSCNELQSSQLQARGVIESKIVAIKGLLSDEFSKTSTEENAQQIGLLTTMPMVLVHLSGQDNEATVEFYKRLLRAKISFQICVLTTPSMAESLKSITAPPRRPVKIFQSRDQLNTLLANAKAIMTDSLDYSIISPAATKRVPMIILGNGDLDAQCHIILKNQLGVCARIAPEAELFIEHILEGKKITDLEKANRMLNNLKALKTVIEAIDSIKPPPNLKVQNYQ